MQGINENEVVDVAVHIGQAVNEAKDNYISGIALSSPPRMPLCIIG